MESIHRYTLAAPESYMLVADGNRIAMVGLDSTDSTLYTIVQGDSLTLYSALAIAADGTIYFSDVNR